MIIEQSSPFTIIRFENIKARNSFGIEEALQLEKALATKPKGLILYSGLSNVFCSGGNLKDYATKTRAQCLNTNKKIRNVLIKLSKLDVPTAVIIDGDCIGGGIELLSAFDHVIASPTSLYAFWQRKIALSFGWGGGERLLRRMSPQHLKEKTLSTSMFDSHEAFRIGLVDAVYPRHLLITAATEWMHKQLQLHAESFKVLKHFSTRDEVRHFERLWGNKSHTKVLKDFVLRSKKKNSAP